MLVNGEKLDLSSCPDIHSLRDLLQHYNLQEAEIAVQMNGDILARRDWDKLSLHDSDSVELIRFVGGG